ncbi:uncharacterized protein LOC107707152 [Sinocyclocheilus rhinocerous]|uniref:uncharacterized protein LOC107707152 n=1 Tax=Sinocyclocheilus rhinocerous TaxID=307959 RepID=UPI0007BAB8BC|nr:PREDICTED: uncharacterized protein LOC107707152 [Sinocyclocheilus rhinocerous]
MREGLELHEEGLRTSTPLLRERERTAHEVEPRNKRGGAKDYREEEKAVCGDVRNYQTEEPEDAPEGTVTPADSVQEALDEMEERCNRTRENLKQADHMTREDFKQAVDSLQQELDELMGKREPMQPHPSPHDYVQRKQYKQVAGTLVMQDIKYPDDRFQVLQTQRRKGEDEHRLTRTSRRAEAPRFECPILIKQGHAQYIPWASEDLDTLVSRLPDIHEGAGKWIRTFKEETIGKLLALGDIKALLAKYLGASKMNDILKQPGPLQAVDRPQADGVSFDKHQRDIWTICKLIQGS